MLKYWVSKSEVKIKWRCGTWCHPTDLSLCILQAWFSTHCIVRKIHSGVIAGILHALCVTVWSKRGLGNDRRESSLSFYNLCSCRVGIPSLWDVSVWLLGSSQPWGFPTFSCNKGRDTEGGNGSEPKEILVPVELDSFSYLVPCASYSPYVVYTTPSEFGHPTFCICTGWNGESGATGTQKSFSFWIKLKSI